MYTYDSTSIYIYDTYICMDVLSCVYHYTSTYIIYIHLSSFIIIYHHISSYIIISYNHLYTALYAVPARESEIRGVRNITNGCLCVCVCVSVCVGEN